MHIEVIAIDHIVLRTTKMAEMLYFYCQVLGCSVERETPKETGLVQLRAGSALIDLVLVDSELGRLGGGAATKTENNLDHFCLQIKSMPEEEICQYLSSFAITVPPFSRRYGAQGFGNSVYIQDPEGNTVELKKQI
ncbi:VOC family protein [Psychromonas sp.]|uniref:VOC family protein n=1 Tax=Psychromonas sp. TaxID=1884585 RepID=UPI0035666CEB